MKKESLSFWEKLELLRKLRGYLRKDLKTSAITAYQPYKKQKLFHDAGQLHHERLFLAGNQVGKSFAGACEVAMHLTGIYSTWWTGKRFDESCSWWIATNTEELCNQNLKRLLFGKIIKGKVAEVIKDRGAFAQKSLIPSHLILKSLKNEFLIKHRSGGISILHFKSYKQGRESWQGATLNGVWFDEEPPLDVYMEGLARTQKLDGIVITTMTPLQGKTNLVKLFLKD